MGERKRDSMTLQFLDEGQQRIAGADVHEVYRTCVQEHMRGRWTARGQCSLQSSADVTDTGKEQVAAGAPYQEPREGERFGGELHVTISLCARQLAEHRASWMGGSEDQ